MATRSDDLQYDISITEKFNCAVKPPFTRSICESGWSDTTPNSPGIDVTFELKKEAKTLILQEPLDSAAFIDVRPEKIIKLNFISSPALMSRNPVRLKLEMMGIATDSSPEPGKTNASVIPFDSTCPKCHDGSPMFRVTTHNQSTFTFERTTFSSCTLAAKHWNERFNVGLKIFCCCSQHNVPFFRLKVEVLDHNNTPLTTCATYAIVCRKRAGKGTQAITKQKRAANAAKLAGSEELARRAAAAGHRVDVNDNPRSVSLDLSARKVARGFPLVKNIASHTMSPTAVSGMRAPKGHTAITGFPAVGGYGGFGGSGGGKAAAYRSLKNSGTSGPSLYGDDSGAVGAPPQEKRTISERDFEDVSAQLYSLLSSDETSFSRDFMWRFFAPVWSWVCTRTERRLDESLLRELVLDHLVDPYKTGQVEYFYFKTFLTWLTPKYHEWVDKVIVISKVAPLPFFHSFLSSGRARNVLQGEDVLPGMSAHLLPVSGLCVVRFSQSLVDHSVLTLTYLREVPDTDGATTPASSSIGGGYEVGATDDIDTGTTVGDFGSSSIGINGASVGNQGRPNLTVVEVHIILEGDACRLNILHSGAENPRQFEFKSLQGLMFDARVKSAASAPISREWMTGMSVTTLLQHFSQLEVSS